MVKWLTTYEGGVHEHAVECSEVECLTKSVQGTPGAIVMCFHVSDIYEALVRQVSRKMCCLLTLTLNQSSMRATKHQKKKKMNSSSGGGSKLMEEGSEDDPVGYETLKTEEKLNLILSKVTLNEKRFKNLESI